MDVELVMPADLDSAFRDWERLFDVDDLATPFNAPAWGRAWLEHWNPEAEPWVMRVHDGDRIVGIAPFALRRERGVRMLSMVGKEPGDYWDVIAAQADREHVAAAVAIELVRRRGDWDAGIVSCLQPDSRTLAGFEAAGLRLLQRVPIRSPALQLPDTFEEYLAGLPRSRRGNLRRHLNRLDRGEVAMRDVTTPGDVSASMNLWRELRSRQWHAMGKQINPLHEHDQFYRFMVQVATTMLENGFTVLWELLHNDRVAAVYLNFADSRSFYWYLGGFDPELSALGLGKIAIGAGLRTSVEAGRQRFDFTRGDDAYKYWYGAKDRMLASVVIGHGGARSRLALTAARVLTSHRDRDRE